MNIKGMNKAEVLASLYNRARPNGIIGALFYDLKPMTENEAQGLIDDVDYSLFFDEIKGRALNVDLSADELNTRLYNKLNGKDAAEKVLAILNIPQ